MKLKEVLVHRPNIEIHSMEKNFEKFSWKEMPKLDKLQKEHDTLIESLREEGIKINYTLKTLESKPNLVFIRDPAFILDGKALILRLTSIRQGEELLVKERIFQLGIKIFGQLIYPSILEGSNIFLIDEKIALIGLDERGNLYGVSKFKEIFKIETHPITQEKIRENFNIINKTAVISEDVIDSQLYYFLKENEFDIILASKKESEEGAVEFLQVSENKLINFKSSLNKKLEKNGFDVIELDLKEFMKSLRGIKSLVLPLDYGI
ncbi:MAG: arginine deiminase-related protein [Candidatus Aenigmatarchaeota archaeon]